MRAHTSFYVCHFVCMREREYITGAEGGGHLTP